MGKADFVKGFSMLALVFGLLLMSLFGDALLRTGPALVPEMSAFHTAFITMLVVAIFQFAWAAAVPCAIVNLGLGVLLQFVAAILGIIYLYNAKQKHDTQEALAALHFEIVWPIVYLILMFIFGVIAIFFEHMKSRQVDE